MEKYSSVFEGLGNLGEPYSIQLKEGAKPHALFTARNVPFALRPKVQQELQRMQQLGVITKVDQPTPWCAGMVTAPQKDGKRPNLCRFEAIECLEVHPLPQVDEILAQRSGAKMSPN